MNRTEVNDTTRATANSTTCSSDRSSLTMAASAILARKLEKSKTWHVNGDSSELLQERIIRFSLLSLPDPFE